MITLIINNSTSQIEGLGPKQDKELRDLLSYTEGSALSTWGVRKKSLLGKRGDFPTGLLSRVRRYLGTTPHTCVDLRRQPIPALRHPSLVLGSIKPYEAQTVATSLALLNHRGCLSLPTGTGKSLVIAMIISALRLRTLVVVPTIEIKKQLKDSFAALFPTQTHITVENIDSAYLKKANDYDALIIDECHHSAAKTYQKLNKTVWQGTYHRYFLTATPFRNNPEETLLFESIAGDLIYQLKYVDAIQRGYIVPIEAYYVESPKQETNAYTWAEVYSQLVVTNTARNGLIANLLKALEKTDKATLCLVKEIKHGQLLSDLTGIPFVNGQDEDSRDLIRQFNSGGIKVLIGTTGVVGEGIDTKPCEYVVIAGLGKAKSAFMQQVGRGVRKYPGKESAKVIIVKDASHKFTARHFNAQKKILKDEYGCIITKLDV